MTLDELFRHALQPACGYLGQRFVDRRSDVLVLALTMQESDGLQARRQRGGPALGFAQFEMIAVKHVLTHRATKERAVALLQALGYPPTLTVLQVHELLEHNDIACMGFARLNLFTHPQALPPIGDVDAAWDQYVAVWKPGAVTKDPAGRKAMDARRRWTSNYATALRIAA